MSAMRALRLVPCGVLLSATLAFGQQGGPEPLRGYMTAVAGATFADQQTPTFGIEYGEHINSHVQA